MTDIETIQDSFDKIAAFFAWYSSIPQYVHDGIDALSRLEASLKQSETAQNAGYDRTETIDPETDVVTPHKQSEEVGELEKQLCLEIIAHNQKADEINRVVTLFINWRDADRKRERERAAAIAYQFAWGNESTREQDHLSLRAAILNDKGEGNDR
ncbi:MAG: hypothetical protein PHX80_03620 [Candidatus Nanoarchaeia archaeon]|nr:hypothetical protein [Candidatus Nanoarchaeia archaeon]